MDIRKFLYESEKTISELARKFGMNRSTICNIRHGKQSPNLITALKLRHLSNNQLDFDLMLCKKDLEEINKWREEHPVK